MSRTKTTMIAALGAALIAAALVPGAAFAYVDLRSPDARDAAGAAHERTYVDLRSPDARDAGRLQPSPPPTPAGESTGTEWGEVGIVAAGVLALVGLGGLILRGRRHGSARGSRAPIVPS